MQTLLVHPKSIYKFRYDDHAQVVNQFTTIVEKNHQDYLPNAVISNDQIDITCIMRPETFSGKILDWLSFLKTSFSQILDHENLVHKGFEVELMWLVYQKELNTTGSEPHSHANSVFSGIYYVDVSENCFTEFLEDDHIFRRSNHVLRKNGSVYGPQVETINFSKIIVYITIFAFIAVKETWLTGKRYVDSVHAYELRHRKVFPISF